MRLVITTFDTYLKAHWLQKLLLIPLIQEIVTKNTANTYKILHKLLLTHLIRERLTKNTANTEKKTFSIAYFA